MSERRDPGPAAQEGAGATGAGRRTGSGPGRILVAVYAVFALAATGRASLQISEKTVQVHIKNLLLKLKVNDRSAAVNVALRRGIIHL